MRNIHESFQDRMHELEVRKFLVRVNEFSEFSKSSPVDITVCDGVKHRTLETGAYDRMKGVADCDDKHDDFEEKTGKDIKDIIPNVNPEWITEV